MGDKWIWDQYWHFDRIASCLDGAGASNYDEAVLAGWRDFFRRLPDRTPVLDLCTGNGAIALVAAEVSRREGKAFAVTAVDQADIDPPAYVTRRREDLAAIRFRAGVAVEALPFPDAHFGAIVSQYGLEYADLPRAVAELGRVMAPGGRARLVVHATEGAVAAAAKRVIADADLLLDEIGLPDAARRCFEAVTAVERQAGATADDRRRAERCLADFQVALARTARHVPAAADAPMCRNSGGVLLDSYRRRGSFDLAQLLAKAEEVRTEILAHRGRLAALVAAALDRRGVAQLCDRLRQAGAETVAGSDLASGADLIGYVAEARFRG